MLFAEFDLVRRRAYHLQCHPNETDAYDVTRNATHYH